MQKRLLVHTAMALAFALLGAAAAELVLRASGFSAPIWYQPDRELGWTLRPGAHGWYTREGHAYTEVNPAGFRDRPHTLEKPAGTYRVAVLGDSVAEAFQVKLESAFWWLLQEKLRTCPALAGREVEVLNFGVSGYGTAQEYLQLQTTAIRYQPDLVLLTFASNDLRNNSLRLEPEKERPFFVAEGEALKLDRSFTARPEFVSRASLAYERFRSASDSLRVLQLAQAARHSLQGWRAGSALANEGEGRKQLPGVEPGMDLRAFAPPRDAAWHEAWTITERLVADIHAFSARHHARFVMAVLTHSAQVHPDPGMRKNVLDALGMADLFYIERRMEALGVREGFPVIALGPELLKRAETQKVFFHGFENYHVGWGHWNENGHRAAADILAPRLCAQL